MIFTVQFYELAALRPELRLSSRRLFSLLAANAK
jgi:hypothetical protein